MESKDASHLWDMLDSATAVLNAVSGVQFEEFISNRIFRSGVCHELQVIGEAARNVSAETRTSLGAIPWRSLIGLRNVLVHEYGEVRYEIIWVIVNEKLPVLVHRLRDLTLEPPTDQK